MKFHIERDDNMQRPDGAMYRFHGSFSENELYAIKLTGLDAAILESCSMPSDFLLALEMIYRKHEQAMASERQKRDD